MKKRTVVGAAAVVFVAYTGGRLREWKRHSDLRETSGRALAAFQLGSDGAPSHVASAAMGELRDAHERITWTPRLHWSTTDKDTE